MCEICKREEVQKFIIWISASVALIGFFGTLTSYVIITDKATSQCNSNGTNCAGANENDPGNNFDNKTLKILSPTALAVGFVIVVVMRCFQGGNRAVVSSNHDEPGPACKSQISQIPFSTEVGAIVMFLGHPTKILKLSMV